MADPTKILDRFQKLVALAMDTNPANIEEQRSAAVQALALLVEHNMTVNGAAPTSYGSVGTSKSWKPDDEFDAFWAGMSEEARGGGPRPGPNNSENPDGGDSWDGQATGPQAMKAATLDTDLDPDFMRTRIKLAWRALQRERARLKTWIYEGEQQTGRRYPRPNPMDWEKDY